MKKKKTVLISAGPTVESIDPVRFISNYSSGKMGYALAADCLKRGFHVILVTGPVKILPPKGCVVVPVQTAQDMYLAMIEHLDTADIILKVAAVADYRVKHVKKNKIKKNSNTLVLTLIKNKDILKKLGTLKRPDQILVGFAAETKNILAYGQKKLREKNLDWIAINDVGRADIGFSSHENEITLVGKNGQQILLAKQSKENLARRLMTEILKDKSVGLK